MRYQRLATTLLALALAGCGDKTNTASPNAQIPEGLYRLTWNKVDTGNANVKIKVRNSSGSEQRTTGTIDVEFSSRNHRLNVCMLSDPTAPPTEAKSMFGNCRMAGDLLIVELGKPGNAIEGIAFELKPMSAYSYAGNAILRAALIPGGKLTFGSAEMTKLP
ncbi:hypothetical protein [Phenylobacterium sp.]|uniref:hypothetical protein n=1 Tax=Phenylobacterium sp. TaxID=1871053 RepID=UPI0037CB2EDD